MPSKLQMLIDLALQQKGAYGAKRVQRAADEIANLEKRYTEGALRDAFLGDNAKAVVTMPPGKFEKYAEPLPFSTEEQRQKYIQYLSTLKGFEDVPFLEINKAPKTNKTIISGHEGRHRSRALEALGDEQSLVRIMPRAALREPLPRRSQEEYIEALRKEIGERPLVIPEGGGTAIELPDIYKDGGAVKKAGGGRMLKNVAEMAAELASKKPLPKGQVQTLSPEEASKNLERFLEQSKIQQRLYHGTNVTEGGKGGEALRKIKPSKEGALGSGAYLTPNPSFASSYAEQAGGNVIPVYAQMKNPLIIEGNGDPMVEALKKLGMDDDKAARMVERAYENKGYIGKEVESRARAQGYDGLMQYRNGELSEVVSYNPNAIKSAIGNVGTYDESSPDLGKSDGGPVHMADAGSVDEAIRAATGKAPVGGKIIPSKESEFEREYRRRLAGVSEPAPAEMREYNPTLQQRLGEAVKKGLQAIGSPESRARELSGIITGGATGSPLPLGANLTWMNPLTAVTLGADAAARSAAQNIEEGNYLGAGLDVLGSALDVGPFVGPAYRSARKAITPVVRQAGKAIDEAMQTGQGPLAGGLAAIMPRRIDVYHGSPHRFAPTERNPLGEFDPSKIGTGEGAQAYGHGLYFAESPGVAESYRKALSDNVFTIDGRAISGPTSKYGQPAQNPARADLSMPEKIASYALDSAIKAGSKDPAAHAIKHLTKHGKGNVDALAALDLVRRWSQQGGKVEGGNLYRVDLPDDQIEKMLDWDVKFESQHPDVQAAILKYWADNPGLRHYGDPTKMTGEGIYGSAKAASLGPEGGAKINLNPSNEAASMDLRYYGIPGIKYLDASSRGAGEGTRNFVIFPGGEELLTIKERMKKGGPVSQDAMNIAVMDKAVRKQDGGRMSAIEPTMLERISGGAGQALERGGKFVEETFKNIQLNPVKRFLLESLVSEPLQSAGTALQDWSRTPRDLTPERPFRPFIRGRGMTTQLDPRVVDVAPIANSAAGRLANTVRNLPTDVMRTALEAYGPQATAAGIIKQKGGNWILESISKSLDPLRQRAGATNTLAEKVLEDMKATYTPENISRLSPESADFVQRAFKELEPKVAINQWIDKKLTNYVKNEMGTPEDPVRALAERGVLHYQSPEIMFAGNVAAKAARKLADLPTEPTAFSPLARNWENISDAAILPGTYATHLPMSDNSKPFKEAIEESFGKYAAENPFAKAYAMNRGILTDDLGFDHIIDELKNAMDPNSGLPHNLQIQPKDLQKITVPQAVERVAKINEWRAAQKAEANKALANNAATVLHKEYPEGYRWVELKQPEQLPEGWRKETREGRDWYIDPEGKYHNQDSSPMRKNLADALKYEGDTMGHCVGGYCDDVASGNTRIYSLRDAKGEPHVTIEVKPPRQDYPVSGEESLSPSIIQIKGKQNRAPKEEYLPFVQDFVKSGKWSDVRDIQNTGLRRIGGKFVDEKEYANAINDARKFLDEHPYFENARKAEQNYLNFQGDIQSPEYALVNRERGKQVDPEFPYSWRELRSSVEDPSAYPEDSIDRIYDIIGRLREKLNPAEGMKRGGPVRVSMDAMRVATMGKPQKKGIGGLTRQSMRSIEEATRLLQAAKNTRSKAVQIEAGLYHPIGGGVKMDKPIELMKAETKADKSIKMVPRRAATFEEMQGGIAIPLVGDRAAAGRILTGVGGLKLKRPVTLEGGGEYMLTHTVPDSDESSVWSSGKGVISGLQKQARIASEYGNPVYGINVVGSPTMVDFNTMLSEALLGQYDPTNLTKKARKEFLRELHNYAPDPSKPHLRPGKAILAADLDDPEMLREKLMAPGAGELRKAFANRMNLAPIQEAGFPNVAEARFAITDPRLVNAPLGTAGFTIGKINPEGIALERTVREHKSYPIGLAGEYFGSLDEPIDYREIFRDFYNKRRLMGKPEISDWRSFGMSPQFQPIDQELVDAIMSKGHKPREWKKGGKVTKKAVGGAMSAAQKAARAFVEARKAKGMPEYHQDWQKALQRGETPPAAPATKEQLDAEMQRLLETDKYKEMNRGGKVTNFGKKKKTITIDAMRMAVADKKLKGKKHG